MNHLWSSAAQRETDPTVPGKGKSLLQPSVGTKFAAHMTDAKQIGLEIMHHFVQWKLPHRVGVYVLFMWSPGLILKLDHPLCDCFACVGVAPVCQCEGAEFPSRGEGVKKFQLSTESVRMEWEATGLPVVSNHPVDSLLDLYGFKWPSGRRILDRLGR